MTAEPPVDHEQVAEFAQIYEAELLAGRLRAEGIDAHVVDQSFHQEPLPTVRSFAVVRVMVPRAQIEQTRRIIADPRGRAGDEGPDVEPGGGGPEMM